MEREGTIPLPTNSLELVNLLNHGVLSVNEVRAQMGLEPVEGGDVRFVMTPTGAIPIDGLKEYLSY